MLKNSFLKGSTMLQLGEEGMRAVVRVKVR
jgi:hypothetical protein